MNEMQSLEEALTIALQLTPQDRLRLVERVVASVERELSDAQPQSTDSVHWGQQLNDLLDTLDLSDWENVDIDDPVKWVKQQREEQNRRHQSFWDKTE